jgi:hypothetical protein
MNVPSVLIGGLALPAYDVVRTTIDIDLAIYVKKQEKLNKLITLLSKNEIKTKQNPKTDHDLFTIFSKTNEAEVWLKPCDKFNWDKEMIKRITEFKEYYKVLAIEDYIMTKLARSDRTPVDHQDILQLLISNIEEIEWDYLHYRLDWIEMRNNFEQIINAFTLEVDSEFEKRAKKILNKYKNSKEN